MSAEVLAAVLMVASAACFGTGVWLLLRYLAWRSGYALALVTVAMVGDATATLVGWWSGTGFLGQGLVTALLAGLVVEVRAYRRTYGRREWL